MIPYDRSAFGYNLIFRAHGSAVYRSVLPSLIAVAIYFLYRHYNTTQVGWGEEDVLHPYAIGVLVSTATFLVVFKLNQAYNRYWEACGNTHQFMSKWMDATTHTSCYHLQCDHYNKIKPPCFYHYPQLNSLFMTRDRERLNTNSTRSEGDDEDLIGDVGLRQRKPGHRSQHSFVPELPPPNLFSSDQSVGSNKISSGSYRDYSTGDHASVASSKDEFGRKTKKDKAKKQKKAEIRRRSISKSINLPDPSKLTENVLNRASENPTRELIMNSASCNNQSIMHLYNVSSVDLEGEGDGIYESGVFQKFGSEPIPLVGKPRTDGNWGEYYTTKDNQPLSTYIDPLRPDYIDPKGFASLQGGRTPPLFLQELAHLSSLMNAVALATLRNDEEGRESPLSIYEPGQPWPEVDPNDVEWVRKKGFAAFLAATKNFFGVGLNASERSKHNAALPLPVIGGVSDAEIRMLQLARGPYAKTQLCFNWLSEFIIREQLAGTLGEVGPPIISRIFQFLGDGMIYYNHARKIMFIPFPFGHAQLSVIFVLLMIVVVPFLMHQYTDEPLVGALLTFMTVLCLEGINEVARDLENPFRNFPNELPLVTFQAQYNEALLTMYAGYHPDFFWEGDEVLQAARMSGTMSDRGSVRYYRMGKGQNDGLPPVSSGDGSVSVTSGERTETPSPLKSPTSGGSSEVISLLKRQLDDQAELIKELYAKMESLRNAGNDPQEVIEFHVSEGEDHW